MITTEQRSLRRRTPFRKLSAARRPRFALQLAAVALLPLLLAFGSAPARPTYAQSDPVASDPVQWQPLQAPDGRLAHLAATADGRTLFAVAEAAVHRTDD